MVQITSSNNHVAFLSFHVLNRSIQLDASRVLSSAYDKPSRWLTSTAIPFIDMGEKNHLMTVTIILAVFKF